MYYRAEKFLGLLLNINDTKKRMIYVCPESHHYFLPNVKHNELLMMLEVDPFVRLLFSVFVGNGYLLHSGTKYLSHHNLLFRIFFDSDDIKLLDTISYGYGSLLPISS